MPPGVRAEATGYFPSLMSPGFASSFTSLRETPHVLDTGDAVVCSSIDRRSDVGVVVVVVVRAEATGYFPSLMSPGFGLLLYFAAGKHPMPSTRVTLCCVRRSSTALNGHVDGGLCAAK